MMDVLLLSAHGYANCFTYQSAQSLAYIRLHTGPYYTPYVHCSRWQFFLFLSIHSIPRHYKKKVVGLERGALSLVNTTEELLDRKVGAPV
jgi:hypothetical protein